MEIYKEAISIITNESNDFKALAIEIAKENPSAVVEAFKKLPNTIAPSLAFNAPFIENLKNSCRVLIGEDKKISAIKLWWAATGCGLGEAKEAIDQLAEQG